MTSPSEKRAARLAFLKGLYEAVDGRLDRVIDQWALADHLEMERGDAPDHVNYLRAEGYLSRSDAQGGISLTHEGLKRIEDADLFPAEPEVRNVVRIENNVNSPILQGVTARDVTLLSAPDVEQLRTILQTLQDGIAISDLPKEDRAEALAQLRTAQSQLASREPDPGILKSTLRKLVPLLSKSAELVGHVEKLMAFGARFGIGG